MPSGSTGPSLFPGPGHAVAKAWLTEPSLHDEGGGHPEHALRSLHVGEDVAMKRPHSRVICLHHDVVGLTWRHHQRVGLVWTSEWEAVLIDHREVIPVEGQGVQHLAHVRKANQDPLSELATSGVVAGQPLPLIV